MAATSNYGGQQRNYGMEVDQNERVVNWLSFITC